MNNRELKLKEISNHFVRWHIQIEHLNSLNLYDANIFSEYSLCELLNTVFDYSLKNINSFEKNFPAIDLGDTENGIAIQVTSTNQRQKIQSTLNKFFEHKLDNNYEKLYIFILGNRQKKYANLIIKSSFDFRESEHILDFKDLLKYINFLPLNRINKIANLLEKENDIEKSKKLINRNVALTKRKLSLKKRMQKDLLCQLDREHWQHAMYEPWVKFKYRNVIIRSVDDKSWPKAEKDENAKMSGWIKSEFWNFYENGLELISMGGDVIVDKNGYWDELNWREDNRRSNPDYTVKSFNFFVRIPFEYIVEYDMEPDAYYGVPTIYVEYANNGTPYEEVLYGFGGWYNKEKPEDSAYLQYFNNQKRKELP